VFITGANECSTDKLGAHWNLIVVMTVVALLERINNPPKVFKLLTMIFLSVVFNAL
jgi:hypothetical protein